ncbi:MAG: DUF2207 domain-containing protein [Bacteroidales bacterium]|nr:DUF2207 domain-containing protein [Candidatus Cacconaster merdequi]
MKHYSRIFLVVLFLTVCATLSFAQEHVVRDIDVTVTLSEDGSAFVKEVWDLSVDKGTEWYLVRENLGDIVIKDLRVFENGQEFLTEDFWDTDRSFDWKKGRCGILYKRDGCELCWGLGSYGNHLFTVEYTMTNVVKSLDDYDCLHMQFVSPGINPYPQHARVTILADSLSFDADNSAIWGFGYHGSVLFDNGRIVADTEEPFVDDFASVIVMARFNKGIFSTTSTLPGTFEEKRKIAFEESDYDTFLENERRRNRGLLAFTAAMFALLVGGLMTSVRRRNQNMFGVMKLNRIGYSREVPFDGDLFPSRYVLSKCGKMGSEANFASALILKMIKEGILSVSTDSRQKLLISFTSSQKAESLEGGEKVFYDMLYEASGEDHILQEKEFSRWSSRKANARRVSNWVENLNATGISRLQKGGFVGSSEFTEQGRRQARNVIGFKKFLSDFTLSEERKSSEVILWQDYLIFASLYGIAKKVAKELKDIDPKAFKDTFGYDYMVMNRVLYFSNNMGSSVVNSVARVQTASSVAGRGGSASFGGGRGFSGGGFGGGAR